jgi:alpha-glucosidase
MGDRDTAVVYAVYPRSFRDTTGTGEGDLRGVAGGLDHIAALSADAIWLCPFYPSPMADGGYDVADHCAVDPRFGTLGDFDALLAEVHDRGMGLFTDLVFNHTSDRGAWFQDAINRGPCADWFVFGDPKPDGGPPNNWISFFGQTAWRWIPRRKQYVFAQFLRCQPCLDLRNQEVQQALSKVVRFWLDRGVDGFRLDAVASYLIDREWSDNPPASAEGRANNAAGDDNPYAWQERRYDMLPGDGADFMETARGWAGEAPFLLGELNSGNISTRLARAFTGAGRLDAVYTVDLMIKPPTAARLAALIEGHAQSGIAWTLSCHDQPRHVTRAGDGSARDARMFAALLAALPGHVVLYQGEELGLPQAQPHYKDLQDPFDRDFHPDPPGRDGARVPLPWRAGAPHAGFSTARPWLPQPEGWGRYALEGQAADPQSVLGHYRRTFAARRRLPALHSGDVEEVRAEGDVLRLTRRAGAQRVCVTANLSNRPVEAQGGGTIVLASDGADGARIPPRSVVWRLLDE